MSAIKKVCIPKSTSDRFCNLVHANTISNKETIGILGGQLKDDGYYVTHIILPDQVGRDDRCQVTSDGYEQLQKACSENDIIQLGWIHTHPSWDVFLSSVDLHNQYLLQSQFAEAFAIVVNPSIVVAGVKEAHVGVYHLNEYGMKTIKDCSQSDFHLHEDSQLLYQRAKHCIEVDLPTLEVINHTGLNECASQRLWKVIGEDPVSHAPVSEDPVSDVHLNPVQPPTYAKAVSNRGWQVPDFDHEYINRRASSGLQYKTVDMLERCQEYSDIELDCALAVSGTESGDTSLRTHLISLENSVVDTVRGGLATTVCYMASFLINKNNRDYLYTRWLESGDLEGFVSSQLSSVHESVDDVDAYLDWQVMTSEDLKEQTMLYDTKRASLKRNGGKPTNQQLGFRWDQTVAGSHTNKKSVQNSHTQLASHSTTPDVRLLGTACLIYKNRQQLVLNADQQTTGYHVQTGIFSDTDLHTAIAQYKFGKTVSAKKSFTDHVNSFDGSRLSWDMQQNIMNSIPNGTKRSGISYEAYFSVSQKYTPSSIRNKVLYHMRRNEPDKILSALQNNSLQAPKRTHSHGQEQHSRTARPVDDYLPDLEPLPQVYHESSQYTAFLEQLAGPFGELKWRIHSHEMDVLLMNDVDLQLEKNKVIFCKNQFIHISHWQAATGSHFFHCSCKLFNAVRRMNTERQHCCHTRFFDEYILPIYSQLFNTSLGMTSSANVQVKIMDSLKTLNIPVVRVGEDNHFHRFSVMSSDAQACCMVNLHAGKFSCQNGRCRAVKGNIRSQKNLAKHACEHLQILSNNRELFTHLCSGNEDNGDSDEDVADIEEQEGLAGDDEHTNTSSQHFNTQTGQWTFESISTHKPRRLDDPILQKSLLYRSSISPSHPDVEVCPDGYYMCKTDIGLEPFSLMPSLDREQLCHCGERYWNNENRDGIVVKVYNKPTNVYLQNGVAKFWIYDRECLQKAEGCKIKYSGLEHGIHILSAETAAGDEIGWDFIKTVTNCQSSLSAYCTITSERYYFTKLSFMSRQTFTKWIFSWMANFKIDFRKQCKFCGTNPRILACDGTKIGMFFKNSSFKKLESPTTDERVSPNHKINLRQFFSYKDEESPNLKEEKRQAKRDLLYFISQNTNCLKEWESKVRKTKNESVELKRTLEERRCNVVKHSPQWSKNIISKYINLAYHQNIIKSLSIVLKVFATDSPLTSLINYRFVSDVKNVLNGIAGVGSLKTELPEICDLIIVGDKYEESEDIKSFVMGILEQINSTHLNDKCPEEPSVKEVYNPESQGRAYYFTTHGGRVRDLPHYDISDSSNSTCRKSFVEAAKSGTTYLFLWFDPIHGHCYGFHTITECEGRKDPFASAYMFLDEAPAELFYDFSCQLEEYSLNREPAFWRKTRFFHDIFHGFSHKCEYVYNSRRISALEVGVNSEICEQFNSYIQKIKYSARAMSQSHFVFFLQFFINMWNEQKQSNVEAEQNIVEAFWQ